MAPPEADRLLPEVVVRHVECEADVVRRAAGATALPGPLCLLGLTHEVLNITAVPIIDGNPDYLTWTRGATSTARATHDWLSGPFCKRPPSRPEAIPVD